ncbi:MAG: helix-hairpin-helix domain-containing protein [Bacteroidota bacterium]|nr:helix-hairpin-helix domain-containing protein [Bacteroidota bacterium]
MTIKSELRELFAFTHSERNGTIVLLIIILMLSIFISLQGKFITLPKEDFTAFDAFLATIDTAETDYTDNSTYPTRNKTRNEKQETPSLSEEAGQRSVYHTKELFNFNPNDLPVDDWVRLGLSPAQARSVKNFEAKGGKFESKEDVKKLFVISAERYTELEPYIVLPEKQQGEQQTNNKKPETRNQKLPSIVELNTADSTLLVSVKGIGPSFAKRIIEYREKLGGYHSINQLTEVYGIDAEKFAVMKDFVKADSSYIRKINVNTAQASDLKRLPYISWTIANGLVNYRRAHGNFKSVAGIRGCVMITEELYNKIAPYLEI